MIQFFSANLSRVIAFLTIIEFEFVLIYRRKYLLDGSKINTALMAVSSLVFIDAFIYTIRTYSHPEGASVPGVIRLCVHLAMIIFFFAFYMIKHYKTD